MSGFGVTFGGLDWSTEAQGGDLTVKLRSLQRGAAAPIVRVVDSLLQDGALEVVDGHENREHTIVIGLDGTDSHALAAYETALHLEVGKPANTLTITPPDGYGVTTAFDVLWANLAPADDEYWDLRELAGYRLWALTFRCRPWGRSLTQQVSEALPVGSGSGVLVNACDSLTGWSSTDSTLSIRTSRKHEGTGSLLAQDNTPTYTRVEEDGFHWYRRVDTSTVTLTGLALDMVANPYLTFVRDISMSGSGAPTVYADGVALEVVSGGAEGDGWMRTTYRAATPSANVAEVKIVGTIERGTQAPDYPTIPADAFPADYGFAIDDLRLAATVGASTGRATIRAVPVAGSARTEASLEVSHETEALGSVIVYTDPAVSATGYSPPLRRFQETGGTATATTGTISGSLSYVGGNVTPTAQLTKFGVPARDLAPGTYLLLARLASASTLTGVEVTTSLRLPGGAKTNTHVTTNANVATAAGFHVLTALTLPPARVSPESQAVAEVTVRATDSDVGPQYDEMFLFRMGTESALTIVDCGDDGSTSPELGVRNNRLFIDAATVSNMGLPAIYVGTDPNRLDAYHAAGAAASWAQHTFRPPTTAAFVANTGAAFPAVRLRHFPRFHTHATE